MLTEEDDYSRSGAAAQREAKARSFFLRLSLRRCVKNAFAPLSAVSHELLILALMGAILLPLGLSVFVRMEAWAKKTGKLKRTG